MSSKKQHFSSKLLSHYWWWAAQTYGWSQRSFEKVREAGGFACR